PNHRRQGVGYGMLCSLLLIGKQRGLERATLEVRRSNLAALALYESVGFQILGQRNGYYHDNGEDAVILWLNGLQQMKTPVA
ncbi:MAG: GNAT family N-acetyltransferase, partial [Synechococcales cyanobacterium]